MQHIVDTYFLLGRLMNVHTLNARVKKLTERNASAYLIPAGVL